MMLNYEIMITLCQKRRVRISVMRMMILRRMGLLLNLLERWKRHLQAQSTLVSNPSL